MADRFAILDGVNDPTPGFTNLKTQLSNVRSERGFAALYYPWITVPNTLTGKQDSMPPSGHIAGIYARTDQSRGVHKAPANTYIRNSTGVVRRLTNEQQGPLNLSGIDIIRVFPDSAQPLVWGARTTSRNTNWQYINVRRLFLYLEESIEQGINWAIFEPHNPALWKKLKRSITEFLTRVWGDGALFGNKAEEAFYVRIDDVLNPPSSLALGRLTLEIGLRPTYPAEFIVVRIGIWQGGSEITES
ncbi:MAG: phage tail sheath family protein [Bryobacteraceae bacterium]